MAWFNACRKDLIAAQREYKRKKNQKKAQRQKQMEEERETEKNKWLNFNAKVSSVDMFISVHHLKALKWLMQLFLQGIYIFISFTDFL